MSEPSTSVLRPLKRVRFDAPPTHVEIHGPTFYRVSTPIPTCRDNKENGMPLVLKPLKRVRFDVPLTRAERLGSSLYRVPTPLPTGQDSKENDTTPIPIPAKRVRFDAPTTNTETHRPVLRRVPTPMPSCKDDNKIDSPQTTSQATLKGSNISNDSAKPAKLWAKHITFSSKADLKPLHRQRKLPRSPSPYPGDNAEEQRHASVLEWYAQHQLQYQQYHRLQQMRQYQQQQQLRQPYQPMPPLHRFRRTRGRRCLIQVRCGEVWNSIKGTVERIV